MIVHDLVNRSTGFREFPFGPKYQGKLGEYLGVRGLVRCHERETSRMTQV